VEGGRSICQEGLFSTLLPAKISLVEGGGRNCREDMVLHLASRLLHVGLGGSLPLANDVSLKLDFSFL